MNVKTVLTKRLPVILLAVLYCLLSQSYTVQSASMNDYCIRPPFVAQAVPPLVMFDVSRDHKLYYVAYNDGVDLNGDGRIDNTYDHSIEYYGYFNPYKCYTHTGGSSSNDYFTPATTTTDRFCASGQWSGNILNWLTMSRMDVIRKVMYGGQRSQESPWVLLNRAYIPQDAHSWGKEYTGKLCGSGTSYKQMCSADSNCDSGYTCQDKSVNLIGIAAPAGGVACSSAVTGAVTWGSASGDPGKGKMLVVRYPNTNGTNDTNHATLMAGFDTTQFFVTPFFVSDFSDSNLNPSNNHGDNYAEIIVGEFTVGAASSSSDRNKPGDWVFAVDGDDGVEMEIRKTSDGTILPSKNGNNQLGWYGGHGWCNDCTTHSDTWTLAASTKYRLIVRHTEGGGSDGVKVWHKLPGGSTWRIFGNVGSGNTAVNFNAPNIITSGASDNTCTLLNGTFIDTGTPTATSDLTSQKYHLFCNTTLSSGTPTSSAASQTTLLRRITDTKHRIWEWSLKERPVCDDTFDDGSNATTNRTDFTVQAEVCKSGVGTLSEKNLFERCRNYGGTYNASTDTYTGGSWMPIGLFQKYGEYNPNDSSGITRVCTKTMGKACSTDNDCGTGEGLCFDKSQMYFGMMTTTYTKNTSGGVLRKNPGPVSDEVNMNNGTQQTSENTRGNLIHSMDRMVLIDFDYSSRSYSNCGWIWDRPINEGECKMWGNPLAELMYENLRYFAGKGTPTAEYTYSTTADSGVNLSKPDWGYTKGSNTYKPFEIYPSCSQPFILLLSDVNTSYDADQIPGSLYPKSNGTFFAEDSLSPHLGLGDSQSSGKSLLNDLMDTISATEGIGGNSNTWFIGESGGTTDFICSPKTATNLESLRGTCPEEPTKKGSYYAAALAYYGKTKFNTATGYSPVSTFVVALSSPFADINIRAGANKVKIVPVAKTVSGCISNKCLGYNGCTYSTDASGRMIFSGCPSDAFCPTNSLVGLFINDVKYNSNNEIVYMKFRQNFEDVEQGADHDMDAIATYEVCTAAAAIAGYGSCASLSLTGNEFEVLVTSSYASGCADQVLGYIISGTTADGTYLVVRDKDIGSGSPVYGLPLESKLKFTSSGTGSAQNLKDPLWYAAKWGGFTGSGKPDTPSKWDKDNDGDPDNYFPVSNPLELDKQLENALLSILARVSSGTAASILNNSEGSGANLLQAVFYPKKPFDNNTEANWIGEMQNLWYFLDPSLQKTSIREDTNQNNTLNLKSDKVAQFFFDSVQSKTKVSLFSDNNGDGAADNPATPDDTIDPDYVKSLWKAGMKLWMRDVSTDPRTIYTGYNSTFGNSPQKISNLAIDGYFNTWPGVWDALQIPAGTNTERQGLATKLISYIHGTDQTIDSAPCLNSSCSYRTRKVTMGVCSNNTQLRCTVPADCPSGGTCTSYNREWKLGDIISSTPRLVSNVKLNQYSLAAPIGYGDTSYNSFINTSTYKNRGMVFVGGNDGMLHAFKLGILKELDDKFNKAMITNVSGVLATSSDNLGREQWAYIPSQAIPYLKYLSDPDYNHLYFVDRTSSVFDASIGRPADGSCALGTDYSLCSKKADTWRTVLIGGMGIGGAAKASTDTCTAPTGCVKPPVNGNGFSSYFALDVTDPESPKQLWEFYGGVSPGTMGYSTTGPAVVRIAAKSSGTKPDNSKNGKWFAVFASGPTGPIDTTKHEFKGQSDQRLRLFIVDIGTGTLVRTIDTGIDNAFGGSLSTSWIDTDRSNPTSDGFYSDDAVYIGYVSKDTSVTPNTWTKGGVLRLTTKESTDPNTWVVSTLIDSIGPVTTSVTKLQDRSNNTLWIYFGTGRYFFSQDDASTTTQQKLYGVKEPCYSTANRTMQSVVVGGTLNRIDNNCTNSVAGTLVDQSGSASTAPASSLAANAPGWSIALDAAASGSLSERVITDPVASAAGAVFFTTFKPSSDVCKYGGESMVWAVNYKTGGTPPANSMKGKALMQVSTGAFAELSLASAFKNPGNLRLEGRRIATPISGVPPTAQGLSLITNPPPVKKFLHVREK